MLINKAMQYANDVVNGVEIVPPEVKIQCEWFLRDLQLQDDDDFKYYFDIKELGKIENILKLLNFATGINIVGTPILNGLWGFQAFFLVNVFGWRFKMDSKKFRYRDLTLFIPRKNAKTFICAVVMLLLLLLEDDYSEFYSICLDRELASKTKDAMMQIIDASPLISKHFKTSVTLSGKITCLLTKSFYQARTAEGNKNNSIKPSAFICDEMGAFKDYKNYSAMKSGQLSVKNPMRMKTTSAYAENESIMLEELDYLRKIYNGVVDDNRTFALLYYAEDKHKWDDIGLMQSNPLRIEANYNEIKDNRKTALEKPSEQTEFLTKHMNIFVQQGAGQKYLDINVWKKCVSESKIDFTGKEIIVGVDASLNIDLTSVSMMYYEDGVYYCTSHGFLPENNLAERREKIDYRLYEQMGYCTICKDKDIVDPNLIEEYIRAIEDKHKCRIKCIVSDPFNIVQTMQQLAYDYNVVLIPQTYRELSPPIKGFRTDVHKGLIQYEQNKLLDWCVSNAVEHKGRTTGDILLEKENKNKQRIDLLMTLIFCYSRLYLEDKTEKYNQLITDDYLDKIYGNM